MLIVTVLYLAVQLRLLANGMTLGGKELPGSGSSLAEFPDLSSEGWGPSPVLYLDQAADAMATAPARAKLLEPKALRLLNDCCGSDHSDKPDHSSHLLAWLASALQW